MISDAILQNIIDRVVAAAQPDRIIGVVPSRRDLAKKIYRSLSGVGVPVDVVVVTPEDVETYRDKVGPIIGPAVREGRVVYVA